MTTIQSSQHGNLWQIKQTFAQNLVYFCDEQSRVIGLNTECADLREQIVTLQADLNKKEMELASINASSSDALKDILQTGQVLHTQMMGTACSGSRPSSSFEQQIKTSVLENQKRTEEKEKHSENPPKSHSHCVAFNDRNGCRKRRNDCWQSHVCRNCSSQDHGAHRCPTRYLKTTRQSPRFATHKTRI